MVKFTVRVSRKVFGDVQLPDVGEKAIFHQLVVRAFDAHLKTAIGERRGARR